MTTPIYNQVTQAFEDVKQTAYKRGYLTAQLDVLKVINNINPSMIAPEQLLLDILNQINKLPNLQLQDEPLPTKVRTRKKRTT
jgi:hypothetical protein